MCFVQINRTPDTHGEPDTRTCFSVLLRKKLFCNKLARKHHLSAYFSSNANTKHAGYFCRIVLGSTSDPVPTFLMKCQNVMQGIYSSIPIKIESLLNNSKTSSVTNGRTTFKHMNNVTECSINAGTSIESNPIQSPAVRVTVYPHQGPH